MNVPTPGPVLVRITVEDVAGTRQRVSTTYSGLASDAKPGDRMLVDDGRIGLQVLDVEGPDVVCEVTIAGAVSDNKRLSLPVSFQDREFAVLNLDDRASDRRVDLMSKALRERLLARLHGPRPGEQDRDSERERARYSPSLFSLATSGRMVDCARRTPLAASAQPASSGWGGSGEGWAAGPSR